MVTLKGNLSKKTLEGLKKRGVKVNLTAPSVPAKAAPQKKEGERSRGESTGTVRVISFDRIVLSKKWTQKLGVKQGDRLNIRLDQKSLVLTK